MTTLFSQIFTPLPDLMHIFHAEYARPDLSLILFSIVTFFAPVTSHTTLALIAKIFGPQPSFLRPRREGCSYDSRALLSLFCALYKPRCTPIGLFYMSLKLFVWNPTTLLCYLFTMCINAG